MECSVIEQGSKFTCCPHDTRASYQSRELILFFPLRIVVSPLLENMLQSLTSRRWPCVTAVETDCTDLGVGKYQDILLVGLQPSGSEHVAAKTTYSEAISDAPDGAIFSHPLEVKIAYFSLPRDLINVTCRYSVLTECERLFESEP